jgi:hypothetical protein
LSNTNAQILFGVVVTFTIVLMLVIGSSIPNVALSSSHHKNKSSSHISSSIGGAPTSAGNSRVSNLNGFNNQSSSSPLYSAPSPQDFSSGFNNSGGLASNDKLVMIVQEPNPIRQANTR